MANESRLSSALGEVADTRQRLTAHEFVRDTMRRAIVSGVLAGGTRLVQTDIAEQLAVSTTPVREALRDLAAEGLIRIDPHRGAVVHELDLAELEEIYEIRKCLEPLALRRAASRITDEQLAEAQRLLDLMAKQKDPAVWVELNSQFHSQLERAADSPRLAMLLKSVQDASVQYVGHALNVVPSRSAEGNREHQQIIDALRAGDANKAAKILHTHLDGTLRAILTAHDMQDKATADKATRTSGVQPSRTRSSRAQSSRAQSSRVQSARGHSTRRPSR